MNFTPFAMFFAAMVVVTLALALWRKLVSLREDDYIHLGTGEERLIPQQVEVSNKLRMLDKYGEVLTVITAVFGVVLGVVYLYYRFQAYYGG
jgi:hypothetical protein